MTTPDRETLAAALLGARWPNGDLIEGVSRVVAELLADALLAGPLAAAVCPYVVTGGEGTSYCRLAAQPPARSADEGLPEEVRERAREVAGQRLEAFGDEVAAFDAAAEVTYAAGRADERAAVVAWLRRVGIGGDHRLERGEHLDD